MAMYTVILLYPECISDDYGGELFVGSAEADSPHHAVFQVQADAANANSQHPDGESVVQEEFRPIMVFEGELDPVLDRSHFPGYP